MKKISFIIFILSLSLFALYNCADDSEIATRNANFDANYLPRVGTSELSYAIKVKGTTDSLTTTFLRWGAKQIEVTETTSSIIYDIHTIRHFNLNGSDIDLSTYSFKFDGTYLSIVGLSGYSVKMVTGELYLQSPEYNGSMASISSTTALSKSSIILLKATNELTSPLTVKTPFIMVTDYGCSEWDKYWYYGVGVSESDAKDNLETAIEEIGTAGCTKIGGVDTSCLGDAHICLSTQEYCCP